MSTAENRLSALHAAVAIVSTKVDADWTRVANDALNFLETGSFQPAAPAPVAADPTTAAPVTRKPRAPKATPATAAESAESAPAPAASAPNTGPAPGAVQPAAPTKTAATAEPTLDDVRNALVQCQTRKGSKAVPQEILNKYSTSKTTGGLPKDKYAAVISECAAA